MTNHQNCVLDEHPRLCRTSQHGMVISVEIWALECCVEV